MARIGLNVPPGFVVSTSVCRDFFDNGSKLPVGLMDEVRDGIKIIEAAMGSKFGEITLSHFSPPVLLSVRSGAAGKTHLHPLSLFIPQ